MSADLLRHHAMELQCKGFTVVSDAGLEEDLIADAKVSCSAEFARMRVDLARLGIDADADLFAFREIVSRHRKRFGFQPQAPSAWTRLVEEAATAVAAPIIETLHSLAPHPDDVPAQAPELTSWARHLLPAQPVLEHVDCIVSQLGAKAQNFHPDAGDTHIKLARLNSRHRLYNVFCPLRDLEEGGDGTQFWPGSHHRSGVARFSEALARSGTLADDAAAMREMEVPACKAGGVILFDFRVLHRGMPNAVGNRAIAHAVLSTGFAKDPLTFPSASLRELVESLPDDPDELQREVAAVRRQQREAWAAVRESSYR
jgi:ectoine hydroxylase-related dioxygenase (phytanoyl-CoA dioxygenase family)